MEQASAALTQLLQRMQQQSAMAFTSDPKAARQELERRKAECYNREEGTLNQQDDYNCPLCRNRGKTVELVMEDGTVYRVRSFFAAEQPMGEVLDALSLEKVNRES